MRGPLYRITAILFSLISRRGSVFPPAVRFKPDFDAVLFSKGSGTFHSYFSPSQRFPLFLMRRAGRQGYAANDQRRSGAVEPTDTSSSTSTENKMPDTGIKLMKKDALFGPMAFTPTFHRVNATKPLPRHI